MVRIMKPLNENSSPQDIIYFLAKGFHTYLEAVSSYLQSTSHIHTASREQLKQLFTYLNTEDDIYVGDEVRTEELREGLDSMMRSDIWSMTLKWLDIIKDKTGLCEDEDA